jgi:hypothetical protein
MLESIPDSVGSSDGELYPTSVFENLTTCNVSMMFDEDFSSSSFSFMFTGIISSRFSSD